MKKSKEKKGELEEQPIAIVYGPPPRPPKEPELLETELTSLNLPQKLKKKKENEKEDENNDHNQPVKYGPPPMDDFDDIRDLFGA